MIRRPFLSSYRDPFHTRITFPLGGIGAGMIGLQGNGGFSHVSLHHRPELNHEPAMFSAVCVKRLGGRVARLLEGPVPEWKIFGAAGVEAAREAAFPGGLTTGCRGLGNAALTPGFRLPWSGFPILRFL